MDGESGKLRACFLSVTLVYCGQMAGWIKMPLGREVGLGPSDIELDGDRAPLPQKRTEPPIFGLCLLWPNGWTGHNGTWHGGRPLPRRHCVRWGPSSPAPKGAQQPPLFGPCPLWPRSPFSATAVLFLGILSECPWWRLGCR